jgi:MFS transporter, DHA3 family, macrolide efflux protein
VVDQAVAARVSSTAVFKRRDFVLMWMAQLVSTAGSALTDLAAGIYVYQRTGSALLVGVTLMATAVPSLVVGLLAGVVVDRFDRRWVMIFSNLGQGVVVALLPLLIGVNISFLFVFILLNAAVKQFFDPAYEAIIPELASEEELTAANAFLSIASFGSTAIGFAGAGLLTAISIQWAFYIDALTFIFSAACILLLKIRPRLETAAEVSVGNILQNLKLGVRTIWDTPMLRSLFALGMPVFFAFGLWNVLLLPMAIKVLGGTEFQYGIQEGLTSVGFVCGSLFMAKYAHRLQTGLWVFVGTMGMAISGILYGLSPAMLVGIVFVTFSGFFNSPASVARQTLLQLHTPRELRGRVFAALFVMRDVIFLAGMAGAGIADLFNVRLLIVISSLILLAVAVAALLVPGVGRPAAEWRRALSAFRAAAPPASAATVRPATLSDFDRLVGRLATFGYLSDSQRASFLAGASVREVPVGERVISYGDTATSAYFILEGETAVGIPDEERGYHDLATRSAGDFFGEIAALTDRLRTADVIATQPSTLLEVPAESLRSALDAPEVRKLVLSTLNERLYTLNQPDLPRLVSRNQSALRELQIGASAEAVPEPLTTG